MISLEKLLPMLGIYPNKIIYKNPEYSTAPKVQHIYLPVPSEPVYYNNHNNHYQHHSKPQFIDFHYSPQRAHLHTTITGSSDIGLKHVTPYNSDMPTIYHAPGKTGSPGLTTAVHIKSESFPKNPHLHPHSESFIPIQYHNHHQPYVHQHVTPAPILKYLTPDHFIPVHPTIPSIPSHVEHKPQLHFYNAHDHSSEHYENSLGHGGGPHLAADESDEADHEHFHIGPQHRHHYEQQHADSLVHHQIQAKQFTPLHPLLTGQKQPFLYQSHYKVLPLSKPLTFNKPLDIKFRSEAGNTKPLVVKPYPNNLYYPLAPPTYVRTDPNIKPVVEQAVEESLRRHQTMMPMSGTNQQKNQTKFNNDDDFKPMLSPQKPSNMTTKTDDSKPSETNAGMTYNMMPNKCEEKCNVETKTKDENSETVCGTNGKIYANKTQFICAQKCGMKGKRRFFNGQKNLN